MGGYGTHKFVSDTRHTQAYFAYLLTVGRAGGLPASQLTTYMFWFNFVLESSNEVETKNKIQGAIGASSST
jgi:hypothetical protein